MIVIDEGPGENGEKGQEIDRPQGPPEQFLRETGAQTANGKT